MVALTSGSLIDLTRELIRGATSPPIRRIAQFAEDEVRLVSGVHASKPYRIERKPWIRLWFDELDKAVRQVGRDREFLRYTFLGPNQIGKTLEAFTILVFYFLFELQEDVICGVPTGDIADAKWNEDLLPFIESSRFAHLLPVRGKGSRKGTLKAGDTIRFRHGCNLTWMSFDGRDKSRAAKTTRVLMITEADGGGEASETSVEEDPIGQLERRALNFDLSALILKESTVSTTKGPVWVDWKQGTESRLVRRCPHCRAWVTPEREHFVGWETAKTVKQAGREAAFFCPACGEAWTDEQRYAANAKAKLVHRGQTIDKRGRIRGKMPDTDTFAFRCTDVDNPFRTSDFLGRAEWRAARAANADVAVRGLEQKHWTIAWQPPQEEELQLDYDAIVNTRNGGTAIGVIPQGHRFVTAGVDIRASQVHYVVVAWKLDGTGRVIAYGKLAVPKSQSGYTEAALLATLVQLRDETLPAIATGWKNDAWYDAVWIDSAWSPVQGRNLVDHFVFESWKSEKWYGVMMPIVGRGIGQWDKSRYSRPTKFGKTIWYVGPDSHGRGEPDLRCKHRVVINVDEAKAWGHSRLIPPVFDDDGKLTPAAVSFFTPATGDHAEFVRHLLSEKMIREYKPGIGEVIVFVSQSRVNHWLDCYGYACSAARSKYCGVEVVRSPDEAPVISASRPVATTQPTQSAGGNWSGVPVW